MATVANNASLLGLPVEMRSLIYREIFEDIIRPLLHPWDDLPKPKDYLSLLLVNREISAETSDVFRKLYAKKLVLYFDDMLDIHWVWKNIQQWPILRDARFWCQTLKKNLDDDNDCQTYGVLMLMDRQPGWDHEWDLYPGFFQTECWQPGFPVAARHRDPEANGFKRTTISHPICNKQRPCFAPFTKLEFPNMANGCKVTTYRWHFDSDMNDTRMDPAYSYPTDSGSMVLEGRIDALTFEGVPVKTFRWRMEQLGQEEPESDEEGNED